jgi:formylglycine-generating enzyme required for sulfatase activity
MTRRVRWSIIAAAIVVASAAGALVVPAWTRASGRADRRARGETEVRISVPAGLSGTVYRAGDTLQEATRLESARESMWLPEGRYFLEVPTPDGPPLFYAISLRAGERGPDADGSFAIAVRTTIPPPLVADASPPFVVVPAGQFELGDRRNPGESQHVWLPAYFIGAFEVTNADFRRFLNDPGGYDDRANWTSSGWAWKQRGTSRITARLDRRDPNYLRFGVDDLPVVLVTWHEARAYCRWLTRRHERDGWIFRLPSEAEWEKAARGPDTFDYGLGMTLSEPQASLYNWKKNPHVATTLVGFRATRERYAPNRYGVYHASGNAAEWTRTLSRPYNWHSPYREDDRNDEEASGLRVTRGGSWYSATTSRLGLMYREEFQPELSSDDLGFRIVAVRLPVATARSSPVVGQ